VVAAHVSVELGHGEVPTTVACGVDEAFVDEARTRRAELSRAAAHDGGDIAGGVLAGAEFRHRA
jgi:hypothetical protein